ncbi:hypothetical protein [Lutibacter sp.]|uniref:hypothetical protein n=1 Tax=Lutibacter sp. TaxID=1925666 RepID=UPI002734D714|nr:hypothetical protein [Lutibacter sp.]MDP3312718.1 hypothetical protein [Lutibacter sp.]
MINIKKSIYIIIAIVFIVGCKKNNEFTIDKGRVGLITEKTSITEFESLFKNDSLVINLFDNNKEIRKGFFSLEDDEYIIYSKSGDKMLEIAVENEKDSLIKIRSIQIFDLKYKTIKGISLISTFKEINKAYKIDRVESTLTSATLFIDELNATIAIDKKELGMLNFTREEISLDQIPEHAKIKFFTIWFN